jgi:hypothetical protein
LAQKHFSEPLMIIEPELSLWRREALGEDLRRTVFNGTNTDRACARNSHCGSDRDSTKCLTVMIASIPRRSPKPIGQRYGG